MTFKTMDPNLIRSLLKDQVDVITPAAEMESEIYKRARCPVCENVGATKVTEPPKIVPTEEDGMVVIKAPFSQNSPLIVGHAKCPQCETEYSPDTGVIISQPEPVITHPHFTGE